MTNSVQSDKMAKHFLNFLGHKLVRPVLSWLLKLELISCDATLNESLFKFAGAAVTKPRLPMAFLGPTEETDGLFPLVRLLDLNRNNK